MHYDSRLFDVEKTYQEEMKKETIELILNISGFAIKKFELIRNGSMITYLFEVHKDGEFQFEVSTESYELALADVLKGIYTTDNVVFKPMKL